jgi:hypothetical protein
MPEEGHSMVPHIGPSAIIVGLILVANLLLGILLAALMH